MTFATAMGTYRAFESAITSWASQQPDVRAIVVYGSRATAGAYDDYSDLDLILFTPSPSKYASEDTWLYALGDIWLAALDHTGAGDPEWFLILPGGHKVDIILSLASMADEKNDVAGEARYAALLAKGHRVIFSASANADKGLFPPIKNIACHTQYPWQDIDGALNLALVRLVKASLLLKRGDSKRCAEIVDSQVIPQLQYFHGLAAEDDVAESVSELGKVYPPAGGKKGLDTSLTPGLQGQVESVDLTETLLSAVEELSSLVSRVAMKRAFLVPSQGQRAALSWLTDILTV